MPTITTSIFSEAVGGQTYVTIILPIGTEYESSIKPGEKFETLWLLHGGGGNSSEWSRMTSIERHALKHRIAVIMPEVGGNFYNDIPSGPKYFEYVTEELPTMLRKYLPLSEKREDNYICGLSMGGFGASKCAFNYPERYAAVGLMSTGPMSPIQLNDALAARGDDRPGFTNRFDIIFGGLDKIPHSVNDIWYVLEKAVTEHKELPRIFNCCGTEDFTYDGYCKFRNFADQLSLDITYMEGPGAHTWDFWDEYLPKFLDWLPLKHRNYWGNWNQANMPLLAPMKNSLYEQ